MASGSTTRADKTLATRRRMVKAAYDQFCANGYLGTTITAIATDAGVAVPTIYYTFGTKARLLDESLGAAILGFDRWHEPPADPSIDELLPWHHWWTDFNAAPTSAEALGIFLTQGVTILERAAPLVAAMHGAAGDPEAADVARIAEQRRVESYREAARVIAAKAGDPLELGDAGVGVGLGGVLGYGARRGLELRQAGRGAHGWRGRRGGCGP